jgi:hypothetical protein
MNATILLCSGLTLTSPYHYILSEMNITKQVKILSVNFSCKSVLCSERFYSFLDPD